MGFMTVPLHRVHLQSDLVNGYFRCGARPTLPVKGVTFIMGTDIAGGKVMPALEVLNDPVTSPVTDTLSESCPEFFPACAVTRAQSRNLGDLVDLSDTVLAPIFAYDESPMPVPKLSVSLEEQVDQSSDKVTSSEMLKLPVNSAQLITAQKGDPSLVKCFSSVCSLEEAKEKEVGYFIDNGILLRKWNLHGTGKMEWSAVYQIVVPQVYRQHVLNLTHDHPWSGHLGVTKTYNRILMHFFWPGLKADVSQFCQTCHICQVAGKPNQVIPPAPLCPIPVIGEPFEYVIIDCVGPLPKSKSGNQFLLTIMCLATRYPEAIPLRKITAPAVVKALLKFFSTFGLPKVIQSDQGTNFMSKLFSQVMQSLSIKHKVSSAYHPESQGSLERFHQTLKSMLRKYCLDSGQDWDEGVPIVLFAVRETIQESLGFSPAELVFGHNVRGPLKILKEQFMYTDSKPKLNVLDYVSQLRERLHQDCSLARETLTSKQEKMKNLYDKKAVSRIFKPGDKVMVLLPIAGSALSARFSGPYVIEK